MPELTGTVRHDDRPLADCQVLAIDEPAGVVLDDDVTGADGRWTLAAPEGALIFARCHGEAVGIVAARAAPGLELDVGTTHELTLRAEADELPDWARPQFRLTPVALDGVDDALLRWLYVPVRDAASRTLAGYVPDRPELTRAVQPGRWWISAQVAVSTAGRVLGAPPPVSWLPATAVTGGGESLTVVDGGFELDVRGPTTLTIRLTPVQAA